MHVKGFLHKLLSAVMHKKRLDSLKEMVVSLLAHKRLSITGLGRGLNLPIQERSGIRRADRFIGNKKLQLELGLIRGQYVTYLIGALTRPTIIVDWTHIPNTRYFVLRAALVAKGRALTIYEEIHTEKNFGTVATETNFLIHFSKLLPVDCKPIIITDAGFRNPWFKQVLKLNWDFIGRIRGTHKYYDGTKWLTCAGLHRKATVSGNSIGKIKLCKKNTISTYLCLLKGMKKSFSRKIYKRKTGGKKDLESYRKSANEPWVLATSLICNTTLQIKKVIKAYKQRMQIEEGFRDLKNPRYGYGLRNTYSKNIQRIEILLLVAMFATLMAWLIGYMAEKEKWHYQFQSNSIKTRRVISLFFLGHQIINRKIKLAVNLLNLTFKENWRLLA